MQRLRASPGCARASRRARASQRARSAGSPSTARDDLAAVDRRARVVAPHRELELAEHVARPRRRRRRRRSARRSARRTGSCSWRTSWRRRSASAGRPAARRGERAHRIGVLVDAVAEALVGEVEVRQQLALGEQRDQRVPLRARQVDAGRVVAAGVQQDDAAARGSSRSAAQHRVEARARRSRRRSTDRCAPRGRRPRTSSGGSPSSGR